MRIFLIVALLLYSGPAVATELGLNVHGFSYHPDRRNSSGGKFNEVNPGLGIHIIVRSTEASLMTLESGVYLNSNDDGAFYTSFSWKRRLTRAFSAGIAASFFISPSYNDGDPFVAPVPSLSWRKRNAEVSLIYFPRYKDVNRNSVFGLYFTIFSE